MRKNEQNNQEVGKNPNSPDYDEALDSLGKSSLENRVLINLSSEVGCYHCCSIYPAENITKWCDDGETALCSNCGVDAVLGNSRIILSVPFLYELHEYWFSEHKI